MKKLVKIQWAAGNIPQIRIYRTDGRLSLSKLELKQIRDEITEFIDYYHDQFNDNNIHIFPVDEQEDI